MITDLKKLTKAIQKLEEKERYERAALDLLAYAGVQNPQYKTPRHIKLLAKKLQLVEEGKIKRLCISVPPRHGKSNLTSEFFPAWYMGKHPDHYIIFATYSQDLADDFGRKVRNQMRDEEYVKIFPNVGLAGDSQSARRFMLNAGGAYFAVGSGGPITGRGAHLLVIDDIIKGREDADSEAVRRNTIDWYKSVAYTRLMPGGAIVIIGTRWHEDDLIGYVLREHQHEGWDEVNIEAIASEDPKRPDPLGREPGEAIWEDAYPLERLLEIKRTLGSRDWSALYQQSPTAEDGNIFKRPWWNWWDKDEPPECHHILLSMDTAFSERKQADPTSILKIGVFKHKGVDNAILLGRVNARFEYPALRRKAMEVYKASKADTVLIEKKASGQSLIQDLRRSGLPIVTYTPDTDKIARANAVAPLVESGRFWVPKKPWAEEFIDQLTAFPNGRHDDDVDAFTQAMLRLKAGFLLTHPEDPEEEDDEATGNTRKGYW